MHAAIKAATFEYIEVFYNRKRQHLTLGYQSSIQHLDNWEREHHQKNTLHKFHMMEGEILREPQ